MNPTDATTPASRIDQPAWLIAHYLELQGISCEIWLAGRLLEAGEGKPRWGLMLTRPIAPDLLLGHLRSLGRHQARLLMGPGHPQHYHEYLQLDAQGRRLLSIRRDFHRPLPALRSPRLLGLLMAPGLLSPLTARRPWRAIRELLSLPTSLSVTHLSQQELAPESLNQLVGTLDPTSLMLLAQRLGYLQIQPDCYAHPNTEIPPEVVLRGPLLIDEGVYMGKEDLHLGPAWLSPPIQPITLPNTTLGQDLCEPPIQEKAYFPPPHLPPRQGYETLKRLFDILFALVALALTAPIQLATALVIKCHDGGPIFFVHTREGIHGRPFGCLKFRTMICNAEALKESLKKANQVDGPQFKLQHDPRITAVGRILRKTNIDELPQFWNVLWGQMSVVGPRPSPYQENQLCPTWREARLSIKPGITGLWQVMRSRQRGGSDFQEWIYFDTQYVERRGFWLDFQIILRTCVALFLHGQ